MGVLSIKYVTGDKLAQDTCRNRERPVISLHGGCRKNGDKTMKRYSDNIRAAVPVALWEKALFTFASRMMKNAPYPLE